MSQWSEAWIIWFLDKSKVLKNSLELIMFSNNAKNFPPTLIQDDLVLTSTTPFSQLYVPTVEHFLNSLGKQTSQTLKPIKEEKSKYSKPIMKPPTIFILEEEDTFCCNNKTFSISPFPPQTKLFFLITLAQKSELIWQWRRRKRGADGGFMSWFWVTLWNVQILLRLFY